MIHYDRISYEKHRDTIVKLLKYLNVAIIAIAMTGCYNAAMMRVSGEARDTCQSDSDCSADYACVFNISADSALGECVHRDNYDPWANRQLEDFIRLKNKEKLQESENVPEANNPDSRWWHAPAKKDD